ncbi:DUF4062 domain-containing protein [Enterococcus sp. LJL51]|uniref:DUF4062 domain-containing protein n=1 Tax=Enterococcus sp. LJL51 TaxID=3416656 RepID=UPI003CE774E2
MNSEKKLQVFISSTYKDLIDERQAAVEAVLNAGHIPAGMELFKAGDQTQKDIIREWIEESDVYLLILGARYGSVDSELNISYTEWEYDLAGELGIPRFSLVLTDDYINEKVKKEILNISDIERNIAPFKNFRLKVESHMVEYIDHKQAIKGAVLGSLNNTNRRNPDLKGWIRYSDKVDEGKFYQLVKENQDLKDQLQKSKIALKKQTENLKQDDDIIVVEIHFDIYNKTTKINKNGNSYVRYEYSSSDVTKIDVSVNEMTRALLPVLIQYGEKGLIKREFDNILEELIFSKAGIRESKEYFNEKEGYNSDFKIPELDRLITQLKLLNFIDFNQSIDKDSYWTKTNVYIYITELGTEEIQRLFAYKK